MIIQTVKQYNAEDMRKYDERVEEWRADKFTNDIRPQIAFVGFRKSNGELKQVGYVASNKNRAYWAKTKRELLDKIESDSL